MLARREKEARREGGPVGSGGVGKGRKSEGVLQENMESRTFGLLVIGGGALLLASVGLSLLLSLLRRFF